ncbi:exosortase N [Flavobacterium foetidum]|uniref:exosortase N n=1 Tax=Flavobacterium foetidum TaxID=2026681 RepID=UPI0013C2F811|nr:exosortase N [Flavobacterium foetidum]KAF2515145.1 exosortase N [Flavobacterium foetidum]
MKNLILKNKPILAVILLILPLLILNSEILAIAVNNDFIGIIVSLFLFFVGGRKTNFRINYILFALILVLEFVSYRLNTKSVHFLALVLLLCLIFHYFTQRFSFIAFICIILFSTIFNTFFIHLTSEIKQNLCYAVYLTLKNFINIDKIEGVSFYINHSKITIDTACMGLSMFKTGLLSCAVLMTLEEQKQKHYYSILQIILLCVLTVVLNILSNYFRIITLVLLNCTQENLLHHSVGLACFVIYQIVPLLLIVRHFKPKITNSNRNETHPKIYFAGLSFLLVLIVSLKISHQKTTEPLIKIPQEYKNEKGSWVNNEVYKINPKDYLIYIKTPGHNPLICWTGNGYKILETKKVSINNDDIWLNKMEKNNQIYYSYWWYKCGSKKYTSFAEVMFMKLLYNEPVILINQTSKSQ